MLRSWSSFINSYYVLSGFADYYGLNCIDVNIDQSLRSPDIKVSVEEKNDIKVFKKRTKVGIVLK